MSEQQDARPDDAPAMPDDRPPAGVCPFLGLAEDASGRFDFPSSEHRCRSAAAPVYVELAHQGTYCLTTRHVSCARYAGPDAVAAGGESPAPALPAAAGEGPPSQPPPAARPSYTLAARGGFGALAATPRGWVPVETSTPVPTSPAAVPAGSMPDGGPPIEGVPSSGPAPDPGTSVAVDEAAGAAEPAEPSAAAGAFAPAAAEPSAAAEPAEPSAAAEPAEPSAAAEPAEPAPDPEGLGALVAAGAATAVVAPEPVPAAVVDATADPAAPPGPSADATSVAVPAADVLAPDDSAGDAADPLAVDGTAALDGPADGTAVLEGPTTLEGPAAGPRIGARLAGIGRHLLRGLAILLAAVLVLAALVGLGYVAGKVLVRPGESVPSAAPSPAPATPLVTPPGPGRSEAPGAGGATAPPIPGASSTPVASTPAAATARPTPTAKPTPRPTPKPRVYVVKSGDTLFAIAERFGVTVNAIITANDITDPNAIYPGQRLTIPRP